jgi:hypothetical protein
MPATTARSVRSDQAFAEGPRLCVAKAEMRGRSRSGTCCTDDRNAALRFLSAFREFRPPEADPPERVVIDPRLPGPDVPDTD